MTAATTGAQVLDVRLPRNEAESVTIREYLITLLQTLWRETHEFSGKRPFGNSDWECDLYIGLINAGLIDGRVDEDGYLERVDEPEAQRLVALAIAELGEVR